MQSPLVKNQIKKALIASAQDEGIQLEIRSLDGNLPLEWTLKGISAKWQEHILDIDQVKMRFSIMPLFKKHVDISYLKFLGGRLDGLPFDGVAKGEINLKSKRIIHISHFLLEGDDLYIRLDGNVLPDFTIEEGNLSFHIPNLSVFNSFFSKGNLMGTAQITKDTAVFNCFAEGLVIQNHLLKDSTFQFEAKRKKTWWEGNAQFEGGHSEIPIEGKCDFRFTPSCHLISIDDFQVDGPQMHFFGKLDFGRSLKCLEGCIFSQIHDLKILRPLLPDSYLKGRLGAKIDFQSFSEFQDLKCQVEVEEFGIYDTTCDLLTVESSLFDLFGDLRGEFSIEGQKIASAQVEFSDVEIKSTFEPHASPFEVSIKGNWKDPFKVISKGSWQKRGGGIFLNVNDFEGYAFNKPFSLCEPFSLEWNTDHFKMSNLSLDIARGHLFSRIDLNKSTTLIKIKAEEFPLEFIPLPHKHFSLAGIGSCDIDLLSWENSIQGNCHVALRRAHVLAEGNHNSLTTKGSLQVHLSDQIAQVHGELKVQDEQFLHFSGSFPIQYQHFPFQVKVNPKKAFSSQLVAEGRLEDLFNFINIGHQRITGWLSTRLHCSKTLENPALQGELEIQDGNYENYYTGTYLREIAAKASANKQTISITALSAKDGEKGSVTATGDILLSPKQNFPFSLTAKLHQLDTVSFDTIKGNFSGILDISGDRLGATAKGKLKVAEATFSILDQLPTVLPQLPITFVNPPEAISRQKVTSPAVSPLILDLDLDVPSKAYVEGRGLSAELKGKLHISGTYTDIVAKGTLQLVKGDYIFSGKVFDLTQGELIFNDKPTPSAYISLSGDCELPNVNVTVLLRGPFSAPKLSFQSSPQLPTGSILSQILFNEDVSQISAAQAIQLAQTVISLSGNAAPDILGKIRKSLGIDRLTIVTNENDPEKLSLQIGKYLMHGLMLTLSQGVESRNVSVEVDLKKGIKLQAEVNETQQGKFSLKWHHHY
ncbi:MAG: hypothetical protein K1000chlam2_01097 [Chlamydiae bacterium]|nr:hypothetical protein [Chlamydiota bacterium]